MESGHENLLFGQVCIMYKYVKARYSKSIKERSRVNMALWAISACIGQPVRNMLLAA